MKISSKILEKSRKIRQNRDWMKISAYGDEQKNWKKVEKFVKIAIR